MGRGHGGHDSWHLSLGPLGPPAWAQAGGLWARLCGHTGPIQTEGEVRAAG